MARPLVPCSTVAPSRRLLLRVAVAGCAFAGVAACSDGAGPDGPPPTGRIVFVHETPDFNTGDIHAINADGSGETVLRSGPEYDHWPSWSPDGRRLVFSTSGPYPAGSTLRVMEADGANDRALALPVAGYAPAWSPDGRAIAYVESTGGNPLSAGGVWVVGADGSGARRVPSANYGECARTCYAPWTVGWWRDGDHVAYGTWAQGTGGTSYGGQYTTRLSDSTIAPLPTAFRSDSRDPLAAWSPDRTVAAVPDYMGIVVRDTAGAEVGRIAAPAPDFGTAPEVSWAPDGQWFAYGAYVYTDVATGAGRYELWVARRNGSGRRRIALDAHMPAWQPTP